MMDAYQKTIAAAVLVILGLAVGFWFGQGGIVPDVARWDGSVPPPAATPPPAGSEQAATSPTPEGMLAGLNAIAVNDQAPGLSVAVAMVALGQNGWVVIHESEEGRPGRILGAKRFDAGSGLAGSIELLRPTAEGQVYFAMLHADDGDRQFDHSRDLPIKDAAGNVILMRFVTAAQGEVR